MKAARTIGCNDVSLTLLDLIHYADEGFNFFIDSNQKVLSVQDFNVEPVKIPFKLDTYDFIYQAKKHLKNNDFYFLSVAINYDFKSITLKGLFKEQVS